MSNEDIEQFSAERLDALFVIKALLVHMRKTIPFHSFSEVEQGLTDLEKEIHTWEQANDSSEVFQTELKQIQQESQFLRLLLEHPLFLEFLDGSPFPNFYQNLKHMQYLLEQAKEEGKQLFCDCTPALQKAVFSIYCRLRGEKDLKKEEFFDSVHSFSAGQAIEIFLHDMEKLLFFLAQKKHLTRSSSFPEWFQKGLDQTFIGMTDEQAFTVIVEKIYQYFSQ